MLTHLYIDPSNHDFARNYLCDFFVFSDFLKFQSLGISRAFSLVVHCSIFKILSKQLSCCNFYIISHSEVFVKQTFCEPKFRSFSFLSFSPWPAFLFYHILSFLSSKQSVNWCSTHHSLFIPDSLSKTVSLFILSHFHAFVKWTFLEQIPPAAVDLPIRSSTFFHSFVLLTTAPVRQLYYYTTLFWLCQVKSM